MGYKWQSPVRCLLIFRRIGYCAMELSARLKSFRKPAGHLPDQLKAMHPKIRWRSIAGIGNVLRHEYHAISDKVIWKVIQDELPPLKAAVTIMKAAIKE